MQLDKTVSARGHEFPLHGTYDEAFARVANAFAENFAVEEEIGAATTVYVDGDKVVDLWGGYRDADISKPWEKDTIVCMMSVAKGIAGMAFNILIDRGLVDPDKPVAHYWPEFAQNGKEGVLVRHVLDHTAGLPVVLDPLWKGAVFDCDAIVAALEKQAPIWQPGTVAAYHIHTQGNLLGEIVRRVTGKRFPQFIRDEVTGPLGADYQYGNLSDADLARCATLVPTVEGTLLAKRDSEPDTLVAKGFTQFPNEPLPVTLNSTAWRRAEITSASGHGNPRAVARIYSAFARGGELDGVRLMSAGTVEDMLTEQHNQTERMQERPYHQARGVLLNTPVSVWMGPNMRAFGHHGFGGSIGMGDPDAKIGFSYCCNKMHARGDNGPRARRIIEALYEAL
ncbi:serine hydrolase domain-containing protein [Mesorhizobium sp. L-8-3]|uniref:serine hydrolase domain-containing protein n=1 Tax=Mesorhizobium sp. L-8-3 TaxID=2744522 RepID=UPI0019286257|nr:serine hydrolase domain-containing protein [Mesorhizobium sp. L-8-3]BCH21263.1 EstA family serine hydrolase [Mesorhizobium sp. L-8-3]